MKIKFVTAFIIILCHSILFIQGAWIQEANFGGIARSRAVGFSIGTKGYIGTGWNGSTIHYKDFWEYNQGTNTWTQKADFGGVARRNAVGFSIGTKGYIGTGYNNASYFNDFWEYDPSLNTWTQKANLTSTGRIAPTGFSIGSKGYIGTGAYTGVIYKDLWEWDQSINTWTQKDSLGGIARESAVSFSIGTKGYLGTGYNSNTGIRYKDFWEWNQSSNTWTQKADVGGGGRRNAVAFSIGTKGYIALGDSVTNVNKRDLWEWDQATNTWTQQAAFGGSARTDATGFSIGTCIYVGTGTDGTLKQDLWQLCFASVVPPVSNFTASDSLFCANGCINFTDQSTNLPTSWLWNFPGATPSSSTVQNPHQVCYSDSGSFNVSLIVTNSGGNDTLTLTNYIKVIPGPPTPIITKSNDTLYCSTNASYTSYQWYLDSNLIPGATNIFLPITQDGNYKVRVTNESGCFSSGIYNVILGIQPVSISQFEISPNPVANRLLISGHLLPGRSILKIYNILGEVCLQSEITNSRPKVREEIDVSSLPAGIYFVRVANQGGSWLGRFVHE